MKSKEEILSKNLKPYYCSDNYTEEFSKCLLSAMEEYHQQFVPNELDILKEFGAFNYENSQRRIGAMWAKNFVREEKKEEPKRYIVAISFSIPNSEVQTFFYNEESDNKFGANTQAEYKLRRTFPMARITNISAIKI